MKTILVPTDFSKISENALAFVLTLAKKFNSEITLLHAYHTLSARPEMSLREHEKELKRLKVESDKRMKVLCDDTRRLLQLECNSICVEGYAKDKIIDSTRERNPDLLVMGTENIDPIDKIIFGTVTGKVLKKVKCPLLIIPEEASFEEPKKIAFALDYHDSDLTDIEFLIEMAKKFNAELHVLRVATSDADSDFEDRLMKDFKDRVDQKAHGVDITWHFVHGGNVASALKEFASANSIDLLAAAKTKLNLLKRLFQGSVTQKLFDQARIPLLIFQARDSDLRSYRMTKADNYE
ncbi:MAG: universal stress protein [Cyclobacteriaceae bacterium]